MGWEMINQFSRTELLLGKEKVARLKKAHVLVFGIGGVGAYAVEALTRCGIGRIDIVDNDTVSLTNINRQLIALHSTLGEKKTEVMKKRMLDINPEVEVQAYDLFFSQETAEAFDFTKYSYVVDAIDTVSSKLLLIELCKNAGTPIICSMGTGNKYDPAQFRVDDIYHTSGCPLARVMRRELKKRGIQKLKVVYSPEEGKKTLGENEEESAKRAVPGTLPFVPPVAGLLLAGQVISDLAEIR